MWVRICWIKIDKNQQKPTFCYKNPQENRMNTYTRTAILYVLCLKFLKVNCCKLVNLNCWLEIMNFDTFCAIWKIRHTTPFLEFSIARPVTICAFRDMSNDDFSTRLVTKMQKHYTRDRQKFWESKRESFWYFTKTVRKLSFLNRSDSQGSKIFNPQINPL